jgi:addiction module HigA family antidote
MIQSFGNRLAEDLFYGRRTRETRTVPPQLLRAARRKVLYLHDAGEPNDLRVPPGNRPEALPGRGKRMNSIRINDQWRIGFQFEHGHATGVAVLDCAKERSMATRLPAEPSSPIHPGEMLLEEFLTPGGITQAAFATRLGWTRARLNELIKGKRGITADAALDLAEVLGTSPRLWMNLQASYDLAAAEKRRAA